MDPTNYQCNCLNYHNYYCNYYSYYDYCYYDYEETGDSMSVEPEDLSLGSRSYLSSSSSPSQSHASSPSSSSTYQTQIESPPLKIQIKDELETPGYEFTSDGFAVDQSDYDGMVSGHSGQALQEDVVHSTVRKGKMLKKPLKDKTCLVCGDRALGYNFNAVSCESCKAFFRRNAFRDIWGRCDGKCEITMESRSYCKKCRLKKCFSVGMKRDLILNERQKQERRCKIIENKSKRMSDSGSDATDGAMSPGVPKMTATPALPGPPPPPSAPGGSAGVTAGFSHEMANDVDLENMHYLSEKTQSRLQEVVQAFRVSFDPPIDKSIITAPNNSDFLNMADASVKRLVKMAKNLTEFKKLDQEDQVSLLKGAVLEVLVLRSVKMFDTKSANWVVPKQGQVQTITAEKMKMSSKESFSFMQHYQNFVTGVLSTIRSDNVILMFLMVLSVLAPDRPSIKDKEAVSLAQEEYASVMREYIAGTYPKDPVMFARVLQKLTDIRNLHDIHTIMLQQANLNDIEPLILEIFDLS